MLLLFSLAPFRAILAHPTRFPAGRLSRSFRALLLQLHTAALS